jgi:hypothetical protein
MSKYVMAYPIKGESYEEIKRCLELFFTELRNVLGEGARLPVSIIKTDNGPGFGDAITDYLKDKDIKHIKGPAYHPQTQGQAEKANQDAWGLPRRLVGAKVRR